MAVETTGVVVLKGEEGPGVPVRVHARAGRLRIESDSGLVGDWAVKEIGLIVLAEGFAIKAEGEELFLRAEDDAGIAEELGVAAASPRMARKVAARHNPDRPMPQEPTEEPEAESNLSALGVAVGGALVVLGAFLISTAPAGATFDASEETLGPLPFWFAFLLGGMLMVGAAVYISTGRKWARPLALLITALVVLGFAILVSRGIPDTTTLVAYGIIAGGMVVGIAVLVSDSG